jgi:outer membrane protein OmpA-like peptidoglycan-associated protein
MMGKRKKKIKNSILTVSVVTLFIAGCASTEVTNEVVKGVGGAVGSLAGGVVGGSIAGMAVGKAVGSLTSKAIRYGVDYSLNQQADEVAKALDTNVEKNPEAAQNPEKNVIVSDHSEYVKIVIRNHYLFSGYESRLSPQASRKLDKLTAVLHNYPHTIVQIAGFTDRRGKYQRNYTLSRKRAKSVSDRLYRAGLKNPSYVTGCSYNKPIVADGSKQQSRINNRIEIYLYREKSKRLDPCRW